MNDESNKIAVNHLMNELENLWYRFSQEYHISTIEFIGCLETTKSLVVMSVWENNDEDDEEEENESWKGNL